MGLGIRMAALAASALIARVLPAAAQETVVLPPIDVTASRIGSGMTGTSTSVITADEIARSPAQSLPDILGQTAGIQVMHVVGGPPGTLNLVDLRGFGAFAQSNVLVLVNGRRFQDFDLQGFDFSAIPLNSIERIEITRGNSGAVLYGDGAVGGVINIVTKTVAPAPFGGRVEAAVGSYGYQEGRVSTFASSGPWSASFYGNSLGASGYRQNSKLNQQNAIANFNYRAPEWSAYLSVAGDRQRQDLPGALPNLPLVYPITLDNPRASVTPFDWSRKQDFNITGGMTRTLANGIDLIVDGGVRRKFVQAQYYNYFNNPTFSFDPSTAVPQSYVDTVMTTSSLTPRLDIKHQWLGLPSRLLTGIDFYNTQYDSDRPMSPSTPPVHSYDIRQTTLALYAMNSTALAPGLDLSFGARVQNNMISARDTYNASVDPNAGFYASNPQAPPIDRSEWQYAAHLGLEYRLSSAVAYFARAARAFRLPNADERVGAGNPFGIAAPANLDLKTQTSYDFENGVRLTLGGFRLQTSVYAMRLNNEIHFIPAELVDVNLDPTQRLGWENSATYQINDAVRLHGGVAYTRATFREGPFAGKDIPLVSRWSGNAGLTWNIVKEIAVFDVTARFAGERRMDNDQANVQPLIPATATVDVQLGGKYERLFWAVAVQNVFDVHYFDYAIASAFTPGYFNAYPQPGRTFMLRAGATF